MSELQMHNICDLSTVRVYLSSLDVRPSSLLRMLRKVRMVDPTKFNPGTDLLRNQGKLGGIGKLGSIAPLPSYKGATRRDVTTI